MPKDPNIDKVRKVFEKSQQDAENLREPGRRGARGRGRRRQKVFKKLINRVRKSGKTNLFAASTAVTMQPEEPEDYIDQNINDLLRGRTGNFWTINSDVSNLVFYSTIAKPTPPLTIDFDSYRNAVPDDFNDQETEFLQGLDTSGGVDLDNGELVVDVELFPDSITLQPDVFETSNEFFLIRADEKNKLFDVPNPTKLFQTMITGGVYQTTSFNPTLRKDVWYEDLTFTVPTAHSNREIEITERVIASKYAKIDPVYNFYIRDYEKAIETPRAREQMLPNIYSMTSELLYGEEEQETEEIISPSMMELNTFGNQLKTESVKSILLDRKKREVFDINEPTGQYFDSWGRQFPEIIRSDKGREANRNLAPKYSNIVVASGSDKLFREVELKKEFFPMYVDIEFDTDSTTNFANLLQETGTTYLLFDELINGNGRFVKSESVEESMEQIFPTPEDAITLEEARQYTVKQNIRSGNKNSINVLEWLEGLQADLNAESPISSTSKSVDDSIRSVEGGNTVIVGDVRDALKVGRDKRNAFYKSLVFTILSARLRELATENYRSYEEIMSGKLAESETVAYRVEKRAGGPDGPVIQNFFFENSGDIDVINFIDTQIKYGKKYTYTIYAYELVYGTRYRYLDAWLKNQKAGVQVEVQPLLKFVEVPYFTYTNIILDSPPVSPDVNFIPYRGVSDRIKIAFNSNVGSYEQFPELIEAEEQTEISKLLVSQDKFSDEKLMYESDDQSSIYEVWRLEKHPTSYQDFAGNKVNMLVTEVDKQTGQKPTSGAVIDSLMPNKKYWYVFRSIDVHGNTSFPSALYQVELVDENGAVFPRIDVVDFADKVPRAPTKSGKRLVQILPRIMHTVLNRQASDLISDEAVVQKWNRDTVYLGVEEETLWGKKFKIRITSSKTGKKVDLNLVFEHRHIKSPPEGLIKNKVLL